MITDEHIQTIRNILFHYQDQNGFLRAVKYVRWFVGVDSLIQAKNCVRDIEQNKPYTKPHIQHEYEAWDIHVSLPMDRGLQRKRDSFKYKQPIT